MSPGACQLTDIQLPVWCIVQLLRNPDAATPPGHRPLQHSAKLPYSRSLGRSIGGAAGRSLSLGRSLSIGPGVERPDAFLRDLGIRGFASRRHVVCLLAMSRKQLGTFGLSGCHMLVAGVCCGCVLFERAGRQVLAVASDATPAIRDQMLGLTFVREQL